MKYPVSRVEPVIDVLHGQQIIDPYRWLEQGDHPDTQAWTAEQNAFTRDYLAAYPGREAIRARLEQLLAIGHIGCPVPRLGRYFYERRDAGQNQPVLYVREGLEGPVRALLDPNTLSADGTTALDWWFPSEDGRLLACGISEHGSELSTLRVLDVATGALLLDRIPHTRAASVAWLPDGSGFYYTRYPARGDVPEGDERYHRAVWLHRLGDDPAADALIFTPAAKEHWPSVSLSPDGRWLLIAVHRTFDQSDLLLQDRIAGTPPVPVAVGLPAMFDGEVIRGRLFVRTNLDAPTYRLFVADPTAPARERWREIVPARPDAVLERFVVAGDTIALHYVHRAASRLALVGLDGGTPRDLALPALGTVRGPGAEWDGDELFYGFSSFTVPPRVYRVDLRSGQQSVWQAIEADIDPSGLEVHQVTYSSKDGTPVTMFLVHQAGLVRDRSHPCYLTAYGGFNVSMTPGFSRSLCVWLERGGVVAIPNIRGGGEYGEAWHQQGMLGRKQNSFDDFLAAAEWLIREGYTRPERLAIAGGSNGGLLMGAALTQRPDLFRAVVVQVPLLDMLRYHLFLIARLWIPEYGSPEDPEQFRWLLAYSPYHRVQEGVAYPAVLLATAESDTRVDPMHARKMAARLQAATGSARPILLRMEERAGHGAGKPVSKVLDELTDTWTFVFKELGL